jgi:CRISPR-associated protein Cmr5
MTMALQTLGQERARHAWEEVERALRAGGDFNKDFADQAKKMPMRIRTAGLAHTLAYLRAKDQGRQVREALENWINRQRPPAQGQPKALVERCIREDSAFLRWATAEALAYLEWLTRFADARKKQEAKTES